MIAKSKSLRYFLISAVILILAILVYSLSMKINSKLQDNKNKIAAEKMNKVVRTFTENKSTFDLLVDKLYSKDEKIKIYFKNGDAIFQADGKEEKIDKECYALLKNINTLLNCKRISLYKSSSGNKILEIYLGSEGGSDELIVFCKSKEKGFSNEFSPGWYYKVRMYT